MVQAIKDNRLYYVYVLVDTLNNKKYVGVHGTTKGFNDETRKFNDFYHTSSKRYKNYFKELLDNGDAYYIIHNIFTNGQDAFDAERLLGLTYGVNTSEEWYNETIPNGLYGDASWMHTDEVYEKISQTMSERYAADKELSYQNGKNFRAKVGNFNGDNNPMFGKNIKDYMSKEDYEVWKTHPNRAGISLSFIDGVEQEHSTMELKNKLSERDRKSTSPFSFYYRSKKLYEDKILGYTLDNLHYPKTAHLGNGKVQMSGKYYMTLKMDGSQASFTLSRDINDNGVVRAFSRNKEITLANCANSLPGFYGWTQSEELWRKIESSCINLANVVVVGEWIATGRIKYKETHDFYMFAAFNKTTSKFYGFDEVCEIADFLDINIVPHEFVDFQVKRNEDYSRIYNEELFIPFMEKHNDLLSEGQLSHEGVVLTKPVYKYDDTNYKVKWVTEAFKENRKVRTRKKQVPDSPSILYIKENITFARVHKGVQRLLEAEAINEEDLSFSNFGSVAHRVNEAVFADILAEEAQPDDFDINEAIKTVNKQVPPHLRKIIQDKESV